MIIRDNFSVLYINIYCDPSSEPSRRDGSDEGSQHMTTMRNKQNYHSVITKYSSYLKLCQYIFFVFDNSYLYLYSRL